MRNYYDLLGVSYTANNQQIKKAYLCILKRYHPDIYQGDKDYAQDLTAKINVAYKVLCSSQERLKYDRSIFPQMYSWNYFYDTNGNRVPIITQTNRAISEIEYDSLPIFSFFHKNKISEFFVFRHSLTPKQRAERKAHRLQFKQLKKQECLKKQNVQFIAKEKAKISKLQLENEYYKGKKKLDFFIILLSIILCSLVGLIIILNLQYTLNM